MVWHNGNSLYIQENPDQTSPNELQGSCNSVPVTQRKRSGGYKGAIAEPDFICILPLILIEKATFTQVQLKRFAVEQQFYGSVCVGKVWLKCIWQSFKTYLIEGNACQCLEFWTGPAQSPQMLQTFQEPSAG